MFVGLIKEILEARPSQCLVCHGWQTHSVCEVCVSRFAQPQPRCQTSALVVPSGARQYGACIKTSPPLDTCLAAVSYPFPWSDLIVGYKFHSHPGRSSAFALLLRSTPWVQPEMKAAHAIVPMPLSRARLRTRGFNQALVLARQLAPDKTDARLLLRTKGTPPQSFHKREERVGSLKDAFAVDPLLAGRIRGARLVLMDGVMTSGATLYADARVMRAAGAAHITSLIIARTE